MAEAPGSLFQGGKSREPAQGQEEEQLANEWEDAKRWSRMDQLAKELTAEKRLEGADEEDDPDRSMKLPFRARAYDFRGPGPQLRRGWRPTSREDSVEAGLPLQVRSYPEEKKEEEGSANRRPEVGTGWVPAPGWASRVWARAVPWGLRPERHVDGGLSAEGQSWGRGEDGPGREASEPGSQWTPREVGGQAGRKDGALIRSWRRRGGSASA